MLSYEWKNPILYIYSLKNDNVEYTGLNIVNINFTLYLLQQVHWKLLDNIDDSHAISTEQSYSEQRWTNFSRKGLSSK